MIRTYTRKSALALALMAISFTYGDAAQNAPPPDAGTANTKPLEFEVVSVKPDKSGLRFMSILLTPDGFTATNAPLELLLSVAYDIRPDLISGGPSWVDSARYDIEAKVSGPDVAALGKLSFSQRRAMLQPLFVDRFKLKVHNEAKLLPVYDLTTAKSGPKLHQAQAGDTYPNGIKWPDGASRAGTMTMGRGTFTGQGIPISGLAKALARQLDRSVIDKTGLTGKYDITLRWTPDQDAGPIVPGAEGTQPGTPPPSNASGPFIFTAIQEQLGLKLEPAKGLVDTLAIDHIEQPSAD